MNRDELEAHRRERTAYFQMAMVRRAWHRYLIHAGLPRAARAMGLRRSKGTRPDESGGAA